MKKPSEIIAFQPETIPEPPPELGTTGAELWRAVMHRYIIDETREPLLKLACLAADRAESCRLEIEREEQTVTGSTGQIAAHPLIAAEGAAQKRVMAFLTKLGIYEQPKRGRPGRPPQVGGF